MLVYSILGAIVLKRGGLIHRLRSRRDGPILPRGGRVCIRHWLLTVSALRRAGCAISAEPRGGGGTVRIRIQVDGASCSISTVTALKP